MYYGDLIKAKIVPPDFGTLGIYSVSVPTGAIAATLGAGSPLFSMQWTNASNLCLVRSLSISGVVSGTITTAVAFDIAATVARSFSAADTGGTAVTLTTNNAKMRTSMGTSLMGDMRAAGTGALTAGTRTLDAQACARVQGFTGTAVGTEIFGGTQTLFDRRPAGSMPIVLAQNEGLIVTNPLSGPATGTITLVVTLEWEEITTASFNA